MLIFIKYGYLNSVQIEMADNSNTRNTGAYPGGFGGPGLPGSLKGHQNRRRKEEEKGKRRERKGKKRIRKEKESRGNKKEKKIER